MNALIHISILASLFFFSIAPKAIGQEEGGEKPPVFRGPLDTNTITKKDMNLYYLSFSGNVGYNSVNMLLLGFDLSYRQSNILFSMKANIGSDLGHEGGMLPKITRHPEQELRDYEILFGIVSGEKNLVFSLQSGMGLMNAMLRGSYLRSEGAGGFLPSYRDEYYNEDKFESIYLPVEISLTSYFDHFGIGLNAGCKLGGMRYIYQVNFLISIR